MTVPVYLIPPAKEIPDDDEDQPKPGPPLAILGPLGFPALHFGAASFSHQYNNDDHLASFAPVRAVRLALRYGIRSFDTSAYYGPSEIILGAALKAIEKEFPRSSYKVTTKCGRYGVTRADFDYSPATLRASVNRSLARLHTDYLDAVFLHDVEFVCDAVGPSGPGDTAAALHDAKEEYGLSDDQAGMVRGDGDRIILTAIAELWNMKDEGRIRSVGISGERALRLSIGSRRNLIDNSNLGYPLPTLLRVALLVLHNPPYRALDVVMSYSNLNLQNSSLEAYAPLLKTRAQVTQVFNASPLNMGLLTRLAPAWHPARAFPNLLDATERAVASCERWEGGLPDVALGYSMRHSMAVGMPVAVGLSSTKEVHESVKIWRATQQEEDSSARECKEREVVKVFEEGGPRNRIDLGGTPAANVDRAFF
ncbi:hypothetical protein HWV62_973 [Athelia sp. TMB]|nr:hypothetical protein HWV62_973 [Athelia sp. TMB]